MKIICLTELGGFIMENDVNLYSTNNSTNATGGNSPDFDASIAEHNKKVIGKKRSKQNDDIGRVYSSSEYQKMMSSQYAKGIKAVLKEAGCDLHPTKPQNTSNNKSDNTSNNKSDLSYAKSDNGQIDELISSFKNWNDAKNSETSILKEQLALEVGSNNQLNQKVEELELREMARVSGVKEEFIDYSIFTARKNHSELLNDENNSKSLKEVFDEMIEENNYLRKNVSNMKSYKLIKSEPIRTNGYAEKIHKCRREGNIEMATKLKAEAAQNGLYLR